jgi:hypothetical protein
VALSGKRSGNDVRARGRVISDLPGICGKTEGNRENVTDSGVVVEVKAAS